VAGMAVILFWPTKPRGETIAE